MPVRIGAFHADAWTGLVLSREPGEGSAFRIAVEKAPSASGSAGAASEREASPTVADLDDFFWLLHEAGPRAPDGRYARVSFDVDLPFGLGADTPVPDRQGRTAGLTLEWARTGEASVVARVRAGFEGGLVVRTYWPWDWRGSWSAEGPAAAVARSASGRSWTALRVAGEPPVTTGPAGPGALELSAPASPGSALRLVAAIGADREETLGAARAVSPGSVDAILDEAAASYDARRTRVAGTLGGLAASVTRNVGWMLLLQPETGRRYTPAGRRWIFPAPPERLPGGEGPSEESAPSRATVPASARPPRDHWTVFGWDSYFNALELAVEDPEAARETLLAGLESQYPNGCVPNWRGRFGGTPDRSQPPVASFAALKLHLRRSDPELLERAYPLLLRWSAWWVAPHGRRPRRAPGPRGLLTWGSDRDLVDPLAPPWERGADARRLAGWESGQDDLPTWDEAEPYDVLPSTTLALDPVDLNAYRVLDLRCLARIADELGRPDEARAHLRGARRLAALVNEHLWDAERQSYGDRRWDGTFTPCRTASHFLVLVAGIPPADRAERMVEHLTDPALFWGDFVVPTVSRDDPRFSEQQYWRGTVWPPVNYLIHAGLARYGFDAVAGEVALRGARMFLDDWRRTGLCRENFDSRTGEGGGQRHQSWGPLFALAALEELADATPWDGLRAGGLRLPEGTEARSLDFGQRGPLDVSAGSDGLRLRIGGREVVASDAPVVLAHLEWEEGRFAAEARAERPVELRLRLPGGRWRAEVDGRGSELSRPAVRLDPGRYRVEVRALP